MAKYTAISALLFLLGTEMVAAQPRLAGWHVKEVHVTSNVGLGLPLGRTTEVLAVKYSSSLGLDVSMINSKYFLYPFVDFLAFGYDQQLDDPAYAYQLERGRSNLYVANLAAGMRKRNDRWGTYAFAGPGVGLLTEPRAEVHPEAQIVVLDNHSSWAPTLRGGAGADYRLGNVFIYVECSYLHYFKSVESRPMHALAVYGGLKTNVTRVADRVIEIITRSPSGTN